VKAKKCLFFILLCHLAVTATADNWRMVVNLQGRWKFSIGDNMKWASPQYNDSDWETIHVPAKWEDEGFNGYNGFAWYRKSFDGTMLKDKSAGYTLFLGYIDDADEVYLNGHKIGSSGAFPPRFQTAYNAQRKYYIPQEYINFQGVNVICVRVYDAYIAGGIVSGEVGIFLNEDDQVLAVNLRGVWDFALYEKRFGHMRFNAAEKRTPPENILWTKITVPGAWENQGYGNFDGSAWYRKQFTIPKSLEGEDLVLVLGKIDDADQTYLNGVLIGATNQYDKLRIYPLSAEQVRAGAVNLLLVYVEDPQGFGGIYEGPVGIMKQSSLTRYLRYRK
jgi:hypothetical protein